MVRRDKTMKLFWNLTIIITVAITCSPATALAYIGPGSGLSAIGAFIALIAAIIVAILGFLWYPFRRLIRYLKKDSRKDGETKS